MESIEKKASAERAPRRIILRVRSPRDQAEEEEPQTCAKMNLPSLTQVIDEMEAMPEADIYANKARLIAALRMADARQKEVASAPTEETPLQRLYASLALVPELLGRFPAKAWGTYLAKLTKIFTSPQAADMDISARLHKIGRTIYVAEEDLSMSLHDWDRLDDAARLCSMIALGTSRPGEMDSQEAARKWLTSKLNIRRR